jgi:hypothetical protein
VRQAGPGDSSEGRRGSRRAFASGAHNAQGQNLSKKLSEVIEDFNALPAVSALARVLNNVANVRSFRRSMVASARALEVNEDESGKVFAQRGQKAVTKRSDTCRPARLLEGSACLH